jgi:hypothetical protein
MRIVTNQKTIKRNRKIGQFATLGSLGILAVGFIISINPDPSLFLWALLALMVGFMLSQIGIYYGNRFGRTPRYDERLNQALKGLDEKYTLYHYMTSVPHLLVGPAGIWVLAAFGQRGTISYDANRKRWIQVGGNVFLKLFGQENLGRPELEVKSQLLDLSKQLDADLPQVPLPAAKAVLVFTDPKAEVADVDEAPILAVHAEKLKDFVRRMARETPAPLDAIQTLQKSLPEETIPE